MLEAACPTLAGPEQSVCLISVGGVDGESALSGGWDDVSSREQRAYLHVERTGVSLGSLGVSGRNSLDLTGVIPQVQGKGPLSDNIASLGNAAYLIANNGNSYAISGGQVNGTNISVDGNQLQDSEFNAVNRAIPTPDSIGEFRVESGVLTADRGRYSGGVITMNTKSGTNQFHGRLFEYFRNQLLNSNSW